MEEGKALLKAKVRTETGTRSSRRLRGEGYIPATLYGHQIENRSLAIEERAFRHFFGTGERVLTLEVEGVQEIGFVKDVQYDPLGERILHVDFTRISLDETVVVSVSVVPFGEPKHLAGGILDQVTHELEIEGPVGRIPKEIRVSVADLEIGSEIRVTDIPVEEGCRYVADPELLVFAAHAARPEEEEVVAPAPEAAEMPEVISEKKEEEGES